MDNYVAQFKNIINVVEYIHNLPDDKIRDLVAKYEILCCASARSATTYDYETANQLVKENIKSYSVYMNKTLYFALTQVKTARESFIDEATNRELKVIYQNSCSGDFKTLYGALLGAYKQLADDIEVDVEVTTESIKSALDNFGLAEIKNNESVADQIITSETEPDIDWETYSFGGEEPESEPDNWKESEEPESDNWDTTPDSEEEQSNESEILEEPDKVATVDDDNSTESFGDDDYSSNEKEYINKLKKVYGAVVNQNIESLLRSLETLYKSGYENGQYGLMVSPLEAESGYIVKLTRTSDSTSGGEKSGAYTIEHKQDSGTFYDTVIFEALCGTDKLKGLKNTAVAPKGESIPNTLEFRGAQFVCQKLHLQFQNGIIAACTGKQTSIRRWITETNPGEASAEERYKKWFKENIGSGTSLVNFKKQIRPWYKWCLENIMYQALMEAEVPASLNGDNISKAIEVIAYMKKNLSNVVVVSDRTLSKDKYTELEIKVCTGDVLTDDEINDVVNRISGKLNFSGGSAIKVDRIGQYENNVLTIGVVFDSKEAEKATVFAGDMIDKIIASGNMPSWSHVLLGRKEDKTYLYWDDFMNPDKASPSKRIYSIFATSRAGKGIMTSTLIAAALADGKQLFYTDGKPENGVGVGKLAWNKGKEAYVFNGTAEGSDPYVGEMENYTNGLRRSLKSENGSELYEYAVDLPKEVFEGNGKNWDGKTHASQKDFFAVMRYLKSMDLCCRIIKDRAARSLSNDDWQVWVFDEMTAMSVAEAKVRTSFLEYLELMGLSCEKKTSSTGANCLTAVNLSSKTKDIVEPGSERYNPSVVYIINWLKWVNSIVATYDDMRTVYLGKSNANLIFIFQEAKWISADMGATMIAKVVSRLNGTKIVGANGLANACQDYGESSTKKLPWAVKINEGTGWWAISKTPDLRTCEVTVFKPLSIYLEPRPGAKDLGKCHYLDEYVTRLLSYVGKDPAEVLNSAYNYADEFVRNNSLAKDLKEWIYNSAKLSAEKVDNSLNSLNKQKETGDGNNESTGGGAGYASLLDSDEMSRTAELNESIRGESGVSNLTGGASSGLTAEEREMLNARSSGNEITSLRKASELQREEHTPVELNEYYTKFIQSKVMNPLAFQALYKAGKPSKETQAMILYIGNFHYLALNGVTGTTNLQTYMSNLEMLIKSGELTVGQLSTLTTIVGLLHAYSNRTLDYDKIPNVKEVIKWAKKYGPKIENPTPETATSTGFTKEQTFENAETIGNQPEQTGQAEQTTIREEQRQFTSTEQFNENSLDGESLEEFGSPAESVTTPIVDVPFGATMNVGNDGTIQLTAPRASQEVLRMRDDQLLRINPKATSVLDKFRKRLYENSRGTAWEFSKLWDIVLKSIEDIFPNKSMVTRIKIQGDTLLVNNTRNIPLTNILGGHYEVRMVDIVSFRALFKQFKFIEILMFDESLLRIVMNEYGASADGIWAMFQSCRSLRSVGVLKEGTNTPVMYRRESMNEQANDIDDDFKEAKFKADLESRMARHNPNLGEKSPGYIKSVMVPADSSLTKKAFNESQKQFKMAWDRLSTDRADIKMRSRISGFAGRGLLSTLSLGAAAVSWVVSEPFRIGKYALNKRR